MKIGFDAKRYYHNNTGLGNYSRTLVGNLQTFFPENEYVLYDESSLRRTFCLGSKARKDGCDLFHGLSNELPVDIKIPSVVTIHDVCWRTFPEMYHFFDRHIYDMKYGSSCKRANRIIAISESTKRDIIDIYGIPEQKISVVYQPVAKNYYIPMGKEEARRIVGEKVKGLPENFILYVGSINRRKNLLSVVKALNLIPADERPFLLIIGNGHEYRREVENYISANGLEKYTRIENSVNDNKTLQALYTSAQLFVYPSFYEGFGLPVVEAALQQTPVITSSVSSLPEAAGNDACLIDPNDGNAVELIAHHIECLITDDTLHKTVAEKMEGYARRMFSPDVLTGQIMDIYSAMM